MSKHDLTGLEKRIHRARHCFDRLGSTEEMDELLIIIHRPGWTTPQELLLVESALEGMVAQMEGLLNEREALMQASRQIGVGEGVAAN